MQVTFSPPEGYTHPVRNLVATPVTYQVDPNQQGYEAWKEKIVRFLANDWRIAPAQVRIIEEVVNNG
jgi:hypothetical protein